MNQDKQALAKIGQRSSFLHEKTGEWFLFFLLVLAVLLVFVFSFTLGHYHMSMSQVFPILLTKLVGGRQFWLQDTGLVIFHIRMPRILAAVMIGAALALSGTTFQGIFKNPLVAPDILGASAGAAFGATIGIFFHLGNARIQMMAFIFGIAAVALTYTISKAARKGANITLLLILSGMVISNFFTALVSFVQYQADPANLLQQSIAFWLMGGLSTLNIGDITYAFVPILVGSIVLVVLRWRLNILSFDDEEAQGMGIDAPRTRLIMLCCTTIITSASVAIGGIIGWVGLIIPNIARIVIGANFRALVPISMCLGAIFLLLADDAARTLFPLDIPIGILTALIGGPVFTVVLIRERDHLG